MMFRKDVTVAGPPLNPAQLRNLLGLVFVEDTDPPALVILLDRAALAWGPVAEDKQAAWAEEVKETWVELFLAQATRGRRLIGVIAWSKDGTPEVECWEDERAFPEVPDEWLDAAVKRAMMDYGSKLSGAERLHGESRIAEWRDQPAPLEPLDQPRDARVVAWMELVEAIRARMLEGAEPEIIIIAQITEIGPELDVLHSRLVDRGAVGHHEEAMAGGFDLLAEYRDQIFRAVKAGHLPLAVQMRTPDGRPCLVSSKTAMGMNVLPAADVERCAAEWSRRMGGRPPDGFVH